MDATWASEDKNGHQHQCCEAKSINVFDLNEKLYCLYYRLFFKYTNSHAIQFTISNISNSVVFITFTMCTTYI